MAPTSMSRRVKRHTDIAFRGRQNRGRSGLWTRLIYVIHTRKLGPPLRRPFTSSFLSTRMTLILYRCPRIASPRLCFHNKAPIRLIISATTEILNRPHWRPTIGLSTGYRTLTPRKDTLHRDACADTPGLTYPPWSEQCASLAPQRARRRARTTFGANAASPPPC